jgi:aminobenzoyl-glutamate utilization protein B
VAASGTSIGFKGADLAARALSSAAVDIYTDPALRDRARCLSLCERRGGDFKYEALLGRSRAAAGLSQLVGSRIGVSQGL